ncbi:MAG: NUDIX hydrolase [Spirochaetes bacterium]|nr:NUDIX hydrolase [Spirochaetota bacterium]
MALGNERWKSLARTDVADLRIFRVEKLRSESPEGRVSDFALVDAPDWACVLPLVDVDGVPHFVTVRQWRHGSASVSVEFPGGALEPGEDPASGVARELLEETGWTARALLRLGTMSPNPAFMENLFHVYLAPGCVPGAGQDLDDGELVDVELEPVENVLAKMGKPPYDHALMVAACHLYEVHVRDSGIA